MKDLRLLDRHRLLTPAVLALYGTFGDGTCGAFQIPSPIDDSPMLVIASVGEGWDHVSVSRRTRCPNWVEMSAVKRLFFLPGETAMELHVPESEHINHMETCLHLWRPNDGRQIPMPPAAMVGPSPEAPCPAPR